jgi:glycogen debranching enzyme
MRRIIKQLPRALPLPKVVIPPTQALRSVTSKNGLGVYASSDRLFRGAVFGRDSLEVAEDLLYIKPKLVEKILLTLASLQGETQNKDNEEEPGKIIHEYRTPEVDGKPINKISMEIYDRLATIWGGNENCLAYYGAVDSTPHFIKVLASYCQAYGMEILAEEVILRSGQVKSVLSVMDDAIEWLVNAISSSRSGLLEYHRKNPHGIENQVWKDSKEFYIHEDGKMASHSHPISSIEIQGLTYDAFKHASELLPSKKTVLDNHAQKIQKKTIELLWQPQRNYFALGTDYDDQNNLRVITTITANPGELLDSLFFEELPIEDKKEFVSGIVREIMGTDFLTDAGIRSRALSEARLVHFWDYHGSYVTWPKETYDIAKGLRRQGFSALSRELENRLLNVIKAIRSYPEFIYVDPRGRILGIPSSSKTHGELVLVDSRNRPERVQAWTVSAILAIQNHRRRLSSRRVHQEPWQSELEKEVLQHIPLVHRMRSSKELSARYPAYPYEINNEEK